MIEKGNKKIINAWTFYDWANSVYPLVVTTAIFPTFYQAVTTQELADGSTSDLISFFGYILPSSAVYSYVVGASFLIVSILSPILGGLADYWGNKKFFLRLFCYIGAISCGSISFFDPAHIELSMISVFMASIGFWGSLVYYNAYLPEIADPIDHDKISARGFSLGYFGSSILLITILVLIMGFGMNARWAFVLVMIWWIGFAQYTLDVLPHNSKPKEAGKISIWKGLQEIKKVWDQIQDIECAQIKHRRSCLRITYPAMLEWTDVFGVEIRMTECEKIVRCHFPH